jgi:hypothetical protein
MQSALSSSFLKKKVITFYKRFHIGKMAVTKISAKFVKDVLFNITKLGSVRGA